MGRPYANNPDRDEKHNAGDHDDARGGALPVGGTQVLEMNPVIPIAGHLLFCECGPVAELLKMPRPFAIAPRADLGSGNNVVKAAHER